MLSRRDLLATTGLSLVATTACGSSPKSTVSVNAATLDTWSQIRDQFQLSRDYLHFSQFFIVSHPRPVREAIERYRRMLDDNPYLTLTGAFQSNQTARVQEAAAEYLGGKPDEVALVDSTTQGLALIYHGLRLRPGQEVLTTTQRRIDLIVEPRRVAKIMQNATYSVLEFGRMEARA